MPRSANPNLLVGFETSDDAGVFLLPDGRALVQTMDFFTPIVDDPYAYGQIAAANALSDVYAMGGHPLTVMNIACFNPLAAPAVVWADVLRGMHDKTVEAGAVCVGGHTVEDNEPKFGLSVTGLIDPGHVWSNDRARPGDEIWLSKPLGTGIVTTAAKQDKATDSELAAAVTSMAMLNAGARDAALGVVAGDGNPAVSCATDITGFGLVGHLFNVARASGVRITLWASELPVLPGVERLVAEGCTTGGAEKTRGYLAERLQVGGSVPDWLHAVALDPQTSGGLAVFSTVPIEGSTRIGMVEAGPATVRIV